LGTAPDGSDIVSKHGGTLTQGIELDLRHYFRITRRSTFAVRLFGARSTGNFPTIYYFGGLDTLRAFDYASEIGNEIAFGNFEYRFPLIDQIRLFGVLAFNNIRGRFFFDIGAAHLHDDPEPFRFWNSSQEDIVHNGVVYGPRRLVD